MQFQKFIIKKRVYIIIGIIFTIAGIALLIHKYRSTESEVVGDNQIKYSESLYCKTAGSDKMKQIPGKSLEYIENELVIDARPDINYKDMEALIKKYNFDIVGYIEITNTYQIEAASELTYDELTELKKDLEKEEATEGVWLNRVFRGNNLSGYYPNDAEWKNEWSENPGGNNWGLEFMNVPEAWYYLENNVKNTPDEVNVGIFELEATDYEHEDLKENFVERPLGNLNMTNKSEKKYKKHGTAVSGIIGAGFNNGIGVSGIIPNVKLKAASWEGITNLGVNYVSSMVCRVALVYLMSLDNDNYKTTIINVSLGYDLLAFAASRENTEAIEALNELNEEVGRFLEILLNKGYDFLICKGAGNNNESVGKNKRYYYVKADADDKNAKVGYIEASNKNAEKYKKYDDYESRLDYGNVDAQYDIFSGITNPEIKDRIVVAGSIGMSEDHEFYASEYSCSGSRVDILAPGEDIYLLEPDDQYSDEGAWGTSYSAPYVSGVAGLMLSANPELSGKELKELLIDSATGQYTSVLNGKTYEYQAVNAENAIRQANEYGKNYTWSLNPDIEADNIYYLNSNDALGTPVNMLNKQLEENYGYAVIKRGDGYGLIDMEGNLLENMNFQSVSTHVSRYHVICQEPRYDSMTGDYTTEFDLSEDGLAFAFGHGDAFGLYGGIYFWNNGLMYRYLANEMPYPKFPIPVQEDTSGVTEKVKSEMKNAWYEDLTGKYAVYADGKLSTDFIYEKCGSFSDGLMTVCRDGKWGYVDRNGEIVIPLDYDASWKEYIPYENHENGESEEFCYAASGGYVVLCKEGEWELRDTYGNEIISMGEFEEIRPVYDGKCWVKKEGKWGVVQINKKEVLDGVLMSQGEFQEKVEGEIILHYMIDDYDGDGKNEAFAITDNEQNKFGPNIEVNIYFISSDNQITLEKINTYGYLSGFCEADQHKFIVWEQSAGGSGSVSYIFGVRNGQAYELQISGKYMDFHEENKRYVGYTGDFSKGYHDYIPSYFIFDDKTNEFVMEARE